MSEITVIRNFAMGQKDNKTSVHVAEMSNGNIWIQLRTPRDGADSLATEMVLTPGTFNLLASAMFRAAHDETAWHPCPIVPKDEVSE
jgi:hypothetical protein